MLLAQPNTSINKNPHGWLQCIAGYTALGLLPKPVVLRKQVLPTRDRLHGTLLLHTQTTAPATATCRLGVVPRLHPAGSGQALIHPPHLILMKAPAQHMAETRPKPVPQILCAPQLACPPKIMGGWMSTTIPIRLHTHPAHPNKPKASPLQCNKRSIFDHNAHATPQPPNTCWYLGKWLE